MAISGRGGGKKYEDEPDLMEYRPLDSSGNDYASMSGMSDIDSKALSGAQSSWQRSYEAGDQAGMDAAHKQAETIRSKYNYSGGADGSQYLPVNTFSYENAPEYLNNYDKFINDSWKGILEREDFSYNPENDPLYQNYKDQYTRLGKNAMEDTIGQISARTGGLASSYAGTAGQQTYNSYMQALTDKIPELQQLAYSMYMDEGERQRANLDMLMALEQGDYNKYLNLLNQYNANRSFDYGNFYDQRNYNYQTGRDAVADQRYDTEWEYGLSRDAVEDEWRNKEWEYGLSRDALEDQRYNQQWDYQLQQDAQSRIAKYFANGGKLSQLDQSLKEQSALTDAELNVLAMLYGDYSGSTGGSSNTANSTGSTSDLSGDPIDRIDSDAASEAALELNSKYGSTGLHLDSRALDNLLAGKNLTTAQKKRVKIMLEDEFGWTWERNI